MGVGSSIGRVAHGMPCGNVALDGGMRAQPLAQNKPFLEAVLGSIQDGISVLDSSLTIRYVNPVMEDWYADQTPLVGKKCHACYQGTDRPCASCPALECLATGEVVRGVVPGPAGSPLAWVEVFAYPFKEPGRSEVTGVIEIIRDVSERKQAEEELQAAEALLSAAVAESPSGIIIADAPDVRIRMANAAAFGIRGARGTHVLTDIEVSNHSKRWQTFHIDGKTPYASEELPLSRAILRGESVTDEEVVIRSDTGEDRIVSANAAPIQDASGRIIAGIVVFHDITKARRHEQERRELHEQLNQSRKMEAIGRLAGGVAHDFNNILTVINGYVEIINLRLDADHPLRDWFEQIRNAGLRAGDLTNQLLAFSRKQVIAPKVLRLNQVVERSQKMLNRMIGEGIDLIFEPGVGLGRIRADPAQIDQILMNLAVNARDALAAGGRLTIRTRDVTLQSKPVVVDGKTQYLSGDFVVLSVCDGGIGMSTETKDRIFEPFFSTKPKNKGTGLGLSTVYGIMQQNHGFIDVISAPDQGATFVLYFPRVPEPSDEVHTLERGDLPRGDETILLVEDETRVRRLVRRILEERGFSVIGAEHGDEALRKSAAHEGEIHLLVTDVIMPGMNGRQLHQEIQKLLPGLRALFVSGYPGDVIADHGVLDKGVSFLAKPFTAEVLTRKVREVLDG